MIEFLSATFSGFTAMSGWEYIAVILSLTYVFLAVKAYENLSLIIIYLTIIFK